MATWTPQSAGLQEVLNTLRASSDTNPEVQRTITEKLNGFKTVTDYIAYLAYIVHDMPEEGDHTRASAGYLLKNNARLITSVTTTEIGQYIKASILATFDNSSGIVQNAVAQTIVAFIGVLQPRMWPDALQQLMDMVESSDIDKQKAAFNVLDMICDDYPKELDFELNGTRPLDYMFPKFLQYADHPVSNIRSLAISCISAFTPIPNFKPLLPYLDAFIACLFRHASDEDPSIRRHVCQSLVFLLGTRPEKLIPHMENVVEYMLHSTKDKDENVALEACEFWLTFAEDEDLAEDLTPFLDRLLPVLLDCMVYTEDQVLWLEAQGEDTEDRPRSYRAKGRGAAAAAAADDDLEDVAMWEATEGTPGPRKPRGRHLRYDGEDEDEDMDAAEDDLETEWTLRKCATATFDALATHFAFFLFDMLLAPLKERLYSTDWLRRESGISLLGALSKGCAKDIEPHLESLMPYLLKTLSDPNPLLRSAVCSTLARNAEWIAEHGEQYLVPILEAFVSMIPDKNHHLQENVCSAFTDLAEKAGSQILPYLPAIVPNLATALDEYHRKARPYLYEAITEVSLVAGPGKPTSLPLSQPPYVEILFPPLIRCWSRLKGDEYELIPLLECLGAVIAAVGASFLAYAGPVYEKTFHFLQHSLIQYQAYEESPEKDHIAAPDENFLVAPLVVIDNIVMSLEASVELLITQSDLFPLLTACAKHPQVPVVHPHLNDIMPALIMQLELDPVGDLIRTSSGASFAVRHLSVCCDPGEPEFVKWVDPLVASLIKILNYPLIAHSMMQSAAITLASMSFMHAPHVAPYLPRIARRLLDGLSEMSDKEDKELSLQGLCALIEINPAGIKEELPRLCNTILRYKNPPPELDRRLAFMLGRLKGSDEVGWERQLGEFKSLSETLATRYGV